MYVVMNRLYVRSQYAGQFEAMFAARSGVMNDVPGFQRNMVLRPVQPDQQPYAVVTMWADAEAFKSWTQSESFGRSHASGQNAPADMYWQKSQLEQYETVLDTSRQAAGKA